MEWENLGNFGLYKEFLDATPKAWCMKEKENDVRLH